MLPTVWTAEEDRILCSKYPSSGSKIPELLSKYSARQIRSRAQRLHILYKDPLQCDDKRGTPVVYKGTTYVTARQACDAVDISYGTLMTYVSRSGQSVQQVFDYLLSRRVEEEKRTQLGKERKPPQSLNLESIEDFPREFTSLAEACRAHGVIPRLVRARLLKGYSFTDAVSEVKALPVRPTRVSKEALGFPVVVDGVTCTTVSRVAGILGISGSALSGYLRRNKCTVKDAVAHYRGVGIRVTGKCPEDVAATHVAYKGLDGKKYSYVLCRVCRKVLLLNQDAIFTFEHGVACAKYCIPESFVLPTAFVRFLRDNQVEERVCHEENES